ncbi:hypothetical protein DY000_02059994 [Brassica cretica]|uniref:Uncharacterized protein n=1 Tax=Brassica cretica TaxID=69181 RepID=A0ABQ7AQA8_BRACR|nr:hypothetical protein DY000_02059994 [Brassica cretica]
MNEGVHKDDTVMSHVCHRYGMSKIRGQIVEESKGEDEPVERCGDGRGGGDSVSNGGRSSQMSTRRWKEASIRVENQLCGLVLVKSKGNITSQRTMISDLLPFSLYFASESNVEESKGEEEPVERCGDGRGGGDSVSNGGRSSQMSTRRWKEASIRVENQLCGLVLVKCLLHVNRINSYYKRTAPSIDMTSLPSIDTQPQQRCRKGASTDTSCYKSIDTDFNRVRDRDYSIGSWADEHHHERFAVEIVTYTPGADKLQDSFTDEELLNVGTGIHTVELC